MVTMRWDDYDAEKIGHYRYGESVHDDEMAWELP